MASAIVKVVQSLGGYLDMEDLINHERLGSDEVGAISLELNGHGIGKENSTPADGQSEIGAVKVWEHPPNGQGIVALMALGILEELQRSRKLKTFDETDHNSTEYLHAVIESLRIAFADARWWITDPDVEKVPTHELISRAYLRERAQLFDPNRALEMIDHDSPAHNHCDTVYFAVTDKYGNAASFINSLYGGFGSCIVPQGCGFALHSRGANFSLQAGHPNAFAPKKRPYHTIIPALVTNASDQSLHSVYGVMGGFMQPQGHVQVLLNMLTFKLNPQAALDAPRVCIGAGMPDQGQVFGPTIFLEEGISEDVAEGLRARGHEVEFIRGYTRLLFGRGQVIRCHMEDGKHVYSAGSDPRGDGAAYAV